MTSTKTSAAGLAIDLGIKKFDRTSSNLGYYKNLGFCGYSGASGILGEAFELLLWRNVGEWGPSHWNRDLLLESFESDAVLHHSWQSTSMSYCETSPLYGEWVIARLEQDPLSRRRTLLKS